MGMPRSATITSAGIGGPINLDWMGGKPTSFTVTGAGTFTYTIEGTLDDVMQTAAPAWFALSSATTANSSVNTFAGPLGGIRLNAASLTGGALTLRVLQGLGW
jgi:hypothetical protein